MFIHRKAEMCYTVWRKGAVLPRGGARLMNEGVSVMSKRGKKRRLMKWVLIWLLANLAVIAGYLLITGRNNARVLDRYRQQMAALSGENREITGTEYAEELAVKCDNGTFVGLEKNRVRSWRGIPYAVPPVGELRWQPPVDAGPDDGVYEAYYYGKSGIQTEAASELSSLYPQGEDCLTLNVFSGEAPGGGGALRPVMVFLHGGAYGWGGTSDPIYDGQRFAEAHGDVVLVTANYRIGLMGFMDFSEVPGGEAYEKSGNLGLLDQVSALRWVQRNIAQFGGDPDQVTIFGESAGASSVSLLPLVAEAKGLFHRVIAQSGSVAFTFSREEARSLTRELLKETKSTTMEDLLALSEEDLMKVNRELNDYNNFPERDGVVLPEDLYAAYASGAASDVDMLTGTNADEARYWIDEVGGYPVYRIAGQLIYGSTVSRLDPEHRRLADAFCALQSGQSIWKKTEFINDLVFRVPAIRQAELHAENGGRHYMYYWTKESAIPHYGACHAVELSYVFNNTDDTIFTGEKADEALAETVQQMWVNFAKTGDPSTDRYAWPAYDADTRQTMFLGDEIRVVSDPLREQRVLVEPLLDYHFNGYYGIVDEALTYLRNRTIHMILTLLLVNLVIYTAASLRRHFRNKSEKKEK